MRLLFVPLIAVFSLQTAARAQQSFSQFEIVIGGTALAQTLSNMPEQVSSEGVWGARGEATVRIGRPFYVEPGIGVSGSTYTISGTYEEDGFEEDLEDVLGHWGFSVPLRAGYRLDPGSTVAVRFFVGLTPTFLEWVEEDNDFEIYWDDYNSTQVSASLGAGVDVLFLTFSALYEFGLTEMFDQDSVGIDGADVKMNGFGGSVGIRIEL